MGGVWGGKELPAQLQGKPVLPGCLPSPKSTPMRKTPPPPEQEE
ncbi:hypothetical protein [Treponema pedis]